MAYVVLVMEGLAAVWFVIMGMHLNDLRRWSLTQPRPKLDSVGRAFHTSAKWAFATGITALYLLSIELLITKGTLL